MNQDISYPPLVHVDTSTFLSESNIALLNCFESDESLHFLKDGYACLYVSHPCNEPNVPPVVHVLYKIKLSTKQVKLVCRKLDFSYIEHQCWVACSDTLRYAGFRSFSDKWVALQQHGYGFKTMKELLKSIYGALKKEVGSLRTTSLQWITPNEWNKYTKHKVRLARESFLYSKSCSIIQTDAHAIPFFTSMQLEREYHTLYPINHVNYSIIMNVPFLDTYSLFACRDVTLLGDYRQLPLDVKKRLVQRLQECNASIAEKQTYISLSVVELDKDVQAPWNELEEPLFLQLPLWGQPSTFDQVCLSLIRIIQDPKNKCKHCYVLFRMQEQWTDSYAICWVRLDEATRTFDIRLSLILLFPFLCSFVELLHEQISTQEESISHFMESQRDKTWQDWGASYVVEIQYNFKEWKDPTLFQFQLLFQPVQFSCAMIHKQIVSLQSAIPAFFTLFTPRELCFSYPFEEHDSVMEAESNVVVPLDILQSSLWQQSCIQGYSEEWIVRRLFQLSLPDHYIVHYADINSFVVYYLAHIYEVTPFLSSVHKSVHSMSTVISLESLSSSVHMLRQWCVVRIPLRLTQDSFFVEESKQKGYFLRSTQKSNVLRQSGMETLYHLMHWSEKPQSRLSFQRCKQLIGSFHWMLDKEQSLALLAKKLYLPLSQNTILWTTPHPLSQMLHEPLLPLNKDVFLV